MTYLIIPAYQPDEKLLQLLQALDAQTDLEIILVNDGSGLASQPIFAQASRFATILHHVQNQGKGEAIKTALRYIREQRRYGVVVTADADGQHSVADICRVAEATRTRPNQLVLGCRAFSGQVPFRSRFGNQLTKFIFKLQTGVAVSDTQTGLRGWTTPMIPFLLKIDGQRYEYEMNMLLEATQHYPIHEVPIETIYIDDNASSHFRPVQDGLRIYKHLFKFALSSMSSFVVDYLVYAVFLAILAGLSTGLQVFLANSVARVVSSTFNYQVNRHLVFGYQGEGSQTAGAYAALVLAMTGLDTLLIYLLHQQLGGHLLLVKLLSGCLLFLVSWWVQKKVIFKERTQNAS